MRQSADVKLWLAMAAAPPWTRAIGGGACVVLSRPSPRRDRASPNEDGAGIVDWGTDGCVLAVADGIGGHGGGEVATDITLGQLSGQLSAIRYDEPQVREAVLSALEAANDQLLVRPGSAGCTILVATVSGDEFRSYHAGDTELVVVGQRGKVKFQTMSHSPVGYAVRSGLLDPEDGLEHEDRHLISNYVGMAGMHIEMTTKLSLDPKDTIVLASDGLWDNMSVDEVAMAVATGPLEEVAESLLTTCADRMSGADEKRRGKADDLTFIIFRHGG